MLTTNILANNTDFLELQALLSTGWVKYQDHPKEDFEKKPLLVSTSLQNYINKNIFPHR